MRTRSLAPLAITLTILLTSTIAFAQHHQRPLPTIPTRFSQPHQTQTIVIPPPNPSGAYQESTVYNLNTGTMTLIRQEGNYTTIIQP
jgi:hypothetical protein